MQQAEPALLLNRGNDYLHYEDDWFIVGTKPDVYQFIVYRGNNDAWKGYFGATVYTRHALCFGAESGRNFFMEATIPAVQPGCALDRLCRSSIRSLLPSASRICVPIWKPLWHRCAMRAVPARACAEAAPHLSH